MDFKSKRISNNGIDEDGILHLLSFRRISILKIEAARKLRANFSITDLERHVNPFLGRNFR